jgi:anaerobic dimethyl sulfoxide reductase subunit C (anchor subunit)
MDVRNWALILFTILAQMSVGSFWVLGVVHYYAKRKANEEEADRLSDRALLVIGPLMILGLLASLFHLGDPLSAFQAVTNVGSSWLSREILFGVLFAILGGLFAIMQWRKWGSFTRRNVVATLAGIAGLFLVISMSGVYMLPTQPAWNTLATPIFFLTTTLLLGSLAMGAAFAANYLYLKRKERDGLDIQLDLLRGSLRGISATALVVLGIQLIVSPLYIAALSAGVPEAQESASMLVNDYVTIFVLRLVLSLVGAGLFAIVLYQSAGGEAKDKTMAYLVYGAFGLVLVAEVLGRYLFYAIQVPVGI